MRSTIRALALAGALFTAGSTVRPAPAMAEDAFLHCVGVCVSAATGCGLLAPPKADMCAIFLKGCFDGCNVV